MSGVGAKPDFQPVDRNAFDAFNHDDSPALVFGFLDANGVQMSWVDPVELARQVVTDIDSAGANQQDGLNFLKHNGLCRVGGTLISGLSAGPTGFCMRATK